METDNELEFNTIPNAALAHWGLSLIEVAMDPGPLSPGATLDKVRAEVAGLGAGTARRQLRPGSTQRRLDMT